MVASLLAQLQEAMPVQCEESGQMVGSDSSNLIGKIIEEMIDTVVEQPAQVVITPHQITLHLAVHYQLHNLTFSH